MNIDLTGRRALVVGGGTYGDGEGIGRAICTAFAGCGAEVIVADCDPHAAHATVERVAADKGRARAVVFDVADTAGTASTLAALLENGPVDILHYNVGIGYAQETQSLPPEKFMHTLDVNMVGLHRIVQAVLPAMRAQQHGVILATSSAWAHRHLGYQHSFYAASKAGLEYFMNMLAQENAAYGIRANTIAPGFIDTPRVRHNLARAYGDATFSQMLAKRAGQVPLGRLGVPADVANLAAFLASDLAAYITGGVFLVDGGLSGARIAG